MSLNTRLLESIEIVTGWAPGTDINTDAASDWVSLKNYDGCLICIHKAAGTAGDDMTIAVRQATLVDGTGTKALNISHLYAKVGATALTAISQFTRYTGTAIAVLDTVTAFGTDLLSDVGESLFVVDVRASDLDVSGGFDCVSVLSEGDDIGNATLSACWFILYGARYPSATPLAAITD